MVLRVIPIQVSSLDDLELPPIMKTIAEKERGLILVTGTTGSGKSTTLAAMVDHINHTRAAHIMTVEDPIEYLHQDDRSIINQREVEIDAKSFAQALRSSLRQDLDVILLGEMRDLETVETGLTAAETGHLVMSTVHTLDATETINRLIAVFPPHQQHQVRLQLASVLRAVVSQRLMPRADETGRSVAVEVLVNTPFVRDCIVDPNERTYLIQDAIDGRRYAAEPPGPRGGPSGCLDRPPGRALRAFAAGTSQYGMQTFDQSIYGLYEGGRVSFDTALRWASNPDEFKMRVQGVTSTSAAARDEMAATQVDNTEEPPVVTRFGD